MAIRHQEILPYKGGQNTTERTGKEAKVKVVSRVAGMHNSGIEPDSLHSALGVKHLSPLLPSDMTAWKHGTKVKPTGAHYNPTESFRKVTPTHSPAGRGYSYGGAPNKKGDSPLGRAMNKVGEKSGWPKSGKKSGGGGKHV